MIRLKVENFAFCEDARLEASGKHVLIGVSAPILNVAQMPANISIALWFSAIPSQTGTTEIDFRVRSPNKIVIVKGKMNVTISAISPASFVLGPMPLALGEAGDYSFDWSFDSKKWEKIGVLRINYVPINAKPTSSGGGG